MSNSSLATWRWNGNTDHYNTRDHVIDKITIHHMAGNLSLSGCCNAVQSRGGSTNYCIDSNGNIGVMIDERYRAWTSSNRENDMRAVTIEVANAPGAGEPNWVVTDKALNACIQLCADICRRNGIKRINYTGNASGNLTMHRWFFATGCPGPYLGSKFPYIAAEVNKLLTTAPAPAPAVKPMAVNPSTGGGSAQIYRVRKSWADAKSQIGAYKSLDNAKKACKSEYTVFDEKGNAVYPETAAKTYKVKVVHDDLNIRAGAGVSNKVVGSIKDHGVYTIVADKVVDGQTWGKLKSGAGWICLAAGFAKKM
ncbi:peptidoglycan recognition protein family protein [Ruminococcus sp.]|uniref:peptidoglycan recognition protein family protein n=1 Tax=Ruminococcus sp. TaxID=41978 RepID=UPI0025D2D5E4|nr:peptidoglycan recognition family protein [Ruminococcus sp.]